jgi:amidophosphoribosyltransferase
LGAIDENTFVVASETCALDGVGAQYVRDILPGEIVYTSDNEDGLQSYLVKDDCVNKICAFEYIYFARPILLWKGLMFMKFVKNRE